MRGETVRAVVDAAERFADREFLADPGLGGTLTFRTFHKRACAMASGLQAMGLEPQDRLLALLGNSAEYAILYFACLYARITIVPVNPALHASEIEFVARNARAKRLVFAERTRGLAPAGAPGPFELEQLAGAGEPAWRAPAGASADDLWTILFTSGTTAFPKAVAHKAGSLLGNARAFNEAMELGPQQRFLHLFPMAYSGGFFNLLLSPFLAGSSVVMTPGWTPRTALDFWRVPREHGVNALWLNPTMAAALVQVDRDEAGRAWCRENVRRCFVGTAPLHVKVKRDFEAAYGVELYESYGLSETLLATGLGPKTGAMEGSVGPALPGIEVKVAGDGEVLIRTPHLMAGLLDYATGDVLAPEGEWFSTGDLGKLSAEGLLAITGRKKDMILRAGFNVSPTAVEEVLLHHEAVAQAAVVGVPSELAGEDVVAVVRLRAGFEPARARAAIEAHCRAGLSSASRPSAVLVREELPTGVTGKVLKKELREWAAARLAAKR